MREEGLDLAAATRQVIGRDVLRPRDAEERFAELRSGVLRLSPHPAWKSWVPDSWTADPFNDRNWRFQLHTLRFLNPVRHLALDGDEAAHTLWLEVVKSWSTHNLDPNDAASKWAWSDMADGLRATQIALGAALIGESELDWYLPTLRAHVDWLSDSRHIVKRNHGMHQLQGLYVASAVLGDKELLMLATTRLLELFFETYDEEGVDDEGAPAYMLHNLRWWSEVFQRFDREKIKVPAEASDRLMAARNAIRTLQQPDGRLPQIGDTPRDSFPPKSIKVMALPGEGQESWSLATGYSVVRRNTALGDQDSYTLLRHGQSGEGHHHDDKGSIITYSRGRNWWVDPGFWNYQLNDPMRAYTKARSSHNVVQILDGISTAAASGSMVSQRDQQDGYSAWIKDTTSYENTIVYRNVTYVRDPEFWLVTDHVVARAPHLLKQQWLIDGGIEIVSDPGAKRALLRAPEATMHMSFFQRGGISGIEVGEGEDGPWIAHGWRSRVKGARVAGLTSDPQSTTISSFSTFDEETALTSYSLSSAGIVSEITVNKKDGTSVTYELVLPGRFDQEFVADLTPDSPSVLEFESSISRSFRLRCVPPTSALPVVPFDDLADVVRKLAPARAHAMIVAIEGIQVPVNIKVSPLFGDRLLVTYNGSVDRRRAPDGVVFQRSRWLRDFQASTVQFADPTLLNDMDIAEGWGQLSESRWAISLYWRIIEELRSNAGFPRAPETLHFGSSAGGFQAIATATYDTGSSVLANNPQLDWMKFHRNKRELLSRRIFGDPSGGRLLSLKPWRVRLIDLFRRKGYFPKLNLMINIDSPTDYVDQLKPFLDEMTSLTGIRNSTGILLDLYKDPGSGHNPLGKEETVSRVNSLLQGLTERDSLNKG